MNRSIYILFFFIFLTHHNGSTAQEHPDWEGGFPDGCTSVTVGKKASSDGSVYTSHTDDSHRTRSWMNIMPSRDHAPGAMVTMYKRNPDDSKAMPTYRHDSIGVIPQVPHTHGFINTAYPCMNEHQLGIGESTFGGRSELQSNAGLIDCQRLCQLMLERCRTAREAIRRRARREGVPLAPHAERIIDLAGYFPMFLQIACSSLFECVLENPDGDPDWDRVSHVFTEEAVPHYSFIWDRLEQAERDNLCRIATGKQIGKKFAYLNESLLRRGYLIGSPGSPSLFSSTFRSFVLQQMAIASGKRSILSSLIGRVKSR